MQWRIRFRGGIAAFEYDGGAFTLVKANRGFYDIMGGSPASYAARFGRSDSDEHRREQIIIMNVIRMAKTLGIKVVSEGVETSSQETFLKSCSCDLVQGFLYAKPMPVSAFEKLEWN